MRKLAKKVVSIKFSIKKNDEDLKTLFKLLESYMLISY